MGAIDSATLPRIVAAIGRQPALDRLADPLSGAVAGAFRAAGPAGRRAQNALNGVWLGHPLHPVLTDLPIGFWTAALALDAVDAGRGDDGLSAASDLALGFGLGSALLTAASGLADWQFAAGAPRRIGVVHATLNGGATLLNGLSLACRWLGARTAGRWLALTAYLLASASSYLGGALISEHRLGVSHAAGEEPPPEFVPVLGEQELAEDSPRRVDLRGAPVVLVRHRGQIAALAESCAHLGGPLSQGSVQGGGIVCPWHGSRFDLGDGHPLDGPSAFAQPVYETRVVDARIEVRGRTTSS